MKFLRGILQKPLGLAAAVSACCGILPRVHGDSHTTGTSREVNLLSLHRNLCEIESTSGDEYQVGQFLQKFFTRHGWTVELQTVEGNRSNVLAYPPTVQNGKAKVLLTSHIDTVPPYIPYSQKDDNTTIWGRGTVDAKGSVATQIKAAFDLVNDVSAGLPDDALALLYVVGEETVGDGMQYFSSHAHHNYSSVIFGEPTEGKLACGHKGALGVLVNITGIAAHSGYPEYGLDANRIMVNSVQQLVHMENELPSSDKFGNTTVNPGVVEGGVAVNVVSPNAIAEFAIRLAASTPKQVGQTVKEALHKRVVHTKESGGDYVISFPIEGYPPINTQCDIEGFETATFNYGTDIPRLEGTFNKYLYGPGSILVSHAANEHLAVSDLHQAVDDYKRIIMHALESS